MGVARVEEDVLAHQVRRGEPLIDIAELQGRQPVDVPLLGLLLDRLVSGRLERRLDGALTGLGTGLTGAVVAEALIRAFAGSYRCEMPGDVECLKRLGPTSSGNPLHDLILAKAVAPENALRLGLIVLGILGDLARTDAMSVLSGEGPA